MDDAVHVEVEVVELDAVGVGTAEIDGDEGAGLELHGLLLLRVGDRQRVAVSQPPVERRDSHLRVTVLSPDLLAVLALPLAGRRFRKLLERRWRAVVAASPRFDLVGGGEG
jgi:hypothetical protein